MSILLLPIVSLLTSTVAWPAGGTMTAHWPNAGALTPIMEDQSGLAIQFGRFPAVCANRYGDAQSLASLVRRIVMHQRNADLVVYELMKLGVRCIEDLRWATDTELAASVLTTIQARKLRHAADALFGSLAHEPVGVVIDDTEAELLRLRSGSLKAACEHAAVNTNAAQHPAGFPVVGSQTLESQHQYSWDDKDETQLKSLLVSISSRLAIQAHELKYTSAEPVTETPPPPTIRHKSSTTAGDLKFKPSGSEIDSRVRMCNQGLTQEAVRASHNKGTNNNLNAWKETASKYTMTKTRWEALRRKINRKFTSWREAQAHAEAKGDKGSLLPSQALSARNESLVVAAIDHLEDNVVTFMRKCPTTARGK
ncbi:hypothetical protein N9L31_00290 [bacterium]|nr:hypothetical protein [bacterium]